MYLVGDCAELGNWDPELAIGPGSCPDYPSWVINAALKAGTEVEFKAIKKDAGGNVVWESGANHSYTVPDAETADCTFSWQ